MVIVVLSFGEKVHRNHCIILSFGISDFLEMLVISKMRTIFATIV